MEISQFPSRRNWFRKDSTLPKLTNPKRGGWWLTTANKPLFYAQAHSSGHRTHSDVMKNKIR